MRYIWAPGARRRTKRMHIQAHDHVGQGYNGALCGIVYENGHRTINAPFALGCKICRHCTAVLNGRRKAPGWLQ